MTTQIIEIGQKIINTGRYGFTGYVSAIHGEQRPATVGKIAGVISYGGGADFDLVDDNGRVHPRVPESLVRGGRPWQICDEIIDQEQINYWLNYADRQKQLNEIEAQKRAEKRIADKEQLKRDYPYLIQVTQDSKGGALVIAAKNVRIELKRSFPGTKFSVTTDRFSMGDALRVEWTDGPTVAEVETITGKYSAGSFDGMEDLYTYSHDVWNDLFGDAKYVTETRNQSEQATGDMIEVVASDYGDLNKPTVEDIKMGRAQHNSPCKDDNSYHYSWSSMVHQAFSFTSYRDGKPVQMCTSCKKQDAYANPYNCFKYSKCLTCDPEQPEYVKERNEQRAARAALIQQEQEQNNDIAAEPDPIEPEAETTIDNLVAADGLLDQLVEVTEIFKSMDQDVLAKSLNAAINPELPEVLEDDFIVYSEGICFASVCTTLSVDDATKELNTRRPSGLHHGWSLSKESFATGQSNPCACDQDAARRHMLFNC